MMAKVIHNQRSLPVLQREDFEHFADFQFVQMFELDFEQKWVVTLIFKAHQKKIRTFLGPAGSSILDLLANYHQKLICSLRFIDPRTAIYDSQSIITCPGDPSRFHQLRKKNLYIVQCTITGTAFRAAIGHFGSFKLHFLLLNLNSPESHLKLPIWWATGTGKKWPFVVSLAALPHSLQRRKIFFQLFNQNLWFRTVLNFAPCR